MAAYVMCCMLSMVNSRPHGLQPLSLKLALLTSGAGHGRLHHVCASLPSSSCARHGRLHHMLRLLGQAKAPLVCADLQEVSNVALLVSLLERCRCSAAPKMHQPLLCLDAGRSSSLPQPGRASQAAPDKGCNLCSVAVAS